MSEIRFANILFERNPRSMSYPAMYCRADGPIVQDHETLDWVLYDRGRYDFTTYFNSLSVNKLRRYANATSFAMHIEVKGASFAILQTRAGAFSHEPEVVEGTKRVVDASDDWIALDFDLIAGDEDVLIGFCVETEGAVSVRNGYYSVSVPRSLRDVELVLATTTFKKEAYIEKNIELVKSQILSIDDDLASHFHMYVIDNGRTLDVNSLQCERISIRPNENVGGAGGFTRGMIEAMEQKPAATHILLMDDDVAVSPESIRRTYNLLRIVNDEYSQAFISGAMLNYEVGEDQWEDTGYMTPRGTFAPAKPVLHLTQFPDLVFNETFRVPKDIRESGRRYAAWWYCVIPIAQIHKNGLPLPVFVRCDDAEYGVRCSPKFMTMNGISIWHDSFHNRYNAAVERYQTTRNTLIARFTTGFSKDSDFLYELHNNVRIELKKFAYDNAELVLDAFEDFMKGPDFIATPGMAEKTFMDANKNKEKLVSFEQLDVQVRDLGLDFDISAVDRQLIDGDKPRTGFQRLLDYVTDNGQRVFLTEGEGFAVIPAAGWVYPAGAIREKKYLIAIDWFNRMGVVRQKDPSRYAQIMARYNNDMKLFKNKRSQLEKDYSAMRPVLTSVDYWKSYLGMC